MIRMNYCHCVLFIFTVINAQLLFSKGIKALKNCFRTMEFQFHVLYFNGNDKKQFQLSKMLHNNLNSVGNSFFCIFIRIYSAVFVTSHFFSQNDSFGMNSTEFACTFIVDIESKIVKIKTLHWDKCQIFANRSYSSTWSVA